MKALRIVAGLGLCAVMATGSANAQDKSKGVWDTHHRNPTATTTTTTAPAPATRPAQPGVLDHGRTHTRRPVVHHSAPTNRPPGWDKGRKTGWGDCDVPPGQAKKVGCTPHRDHRWVQRRDRRWEERREHERRDARRRAAVRHERIERAERRHEHIEMAKRGRH